MIHRLLEDAVSRHGDRVAVGGGGIRWTYRELAARSAGLDGTLRGAGLSAGDRAGVLAGNVPEYLAAYFGAARAGVVLVPLNVRLTGSDLREILLDAGARTLLFAAEQGPLAESLGVSAIPLEAAARPGGETASPVEPGAGEAAHLYYTSGTTGRPKGVVLTHGNVTVHAESAVAEFGLGAADRWGHIAPLFHLADAWATFAITAAGGRHVMLPRFTPKAALEAFEREGITITNLVPTMLNLMLAEPGAARVDASSLRLLLTGGAPIAPEVVRRAVGTFGCDYAQTYGMTETSPYLTVSLLSPEEEALPEEERLLRKSRTGRPFRGVELRVLDAAGRDVPRDDVAVGEIVVRGPSVSPGYWRRPEETAAAWRDGWLRTGDLATIDARGSVNIVDRMKDLILTGGENVFSIEVENALYLHPAVLEAAVVGRPDETWGEVVTAFVVLRSGAVATAEEIRVFCRGRLAPFKVPRRVVFREELPKTGSGKLAKRLLRGQCD